MGSITPTADGLHASWGSTGLLESFDGDGSARLRMGSQLGFAFGFSTWHASVYTNSTEYLPPE